MICAANAVRRLVLVVAHISIWIAVINYLSSGCLAGIAVAQASDDVVPASNSLEQTSACEGRVIADCHSQECCDTEDRHGDGDGSCWFVGDGELSRVYDPADSSSVVQDNDDQDDYNDDQDGGGDWPICDLDPEYSGRRDAFRVVAWLEIGAPHRTPKSAVLELISDRLCLLCRIRRALSGAVAMGRADLPKPLQQESEAATRSVVATCSLCQEMLECTDLYLHKRNNSL